MHVLRGRYRWVICALLFVATTINYIDRQVIGLLKPDLQHQFSWTERDYAAIVFTFQLAYAIGLLAGRPGDGQAGDEEGLLARHPAVERGRHRPRLRRLHAVAAVSHAEPRREDRRLVRHAWAAPPPASRSPASSSASARPAISRHRSRPSPSGSRARSGRSPPGIFNSGTNIGALITPLVVPPLVALWGWQGAFVGDRPARLLLAGLVVGQLRHAGPASARQRRGTGADPERSVRAGDADRLGPAHVLPAGMGLRPGQVPDRSGVVAVPVLDPRFPEPQLRPRPEAVRCCRCSRST